MTDSATYTKALVEVDSSGNTYATVRLKLMDNIQDPKFQVDAAGNGSFTPVSSTVMYEDFTENTTDFRMKVPNENAVIRCNMYVVPMGREVIFYITLSGLQQGSGDFVTTIKVDQAQSSVTNGAGSQTPTQTESQNTAQTSDGSAQLRPRGRNPQPRLVKPMRNTWGYRNLTKPEKRQMIAPAYLPSGGLQELWSSLLQPEAPYGFSG